MRLYLTKLVVAGCLSISTLAVAASATPEVNKALQGTFNGVRVDYTALVERIPVADSAANTAADLVAFSYIAQSSAGKQRPVIFVFNGGPISPSVFLHMLALGPKRLAVPDDLSADPAKFKTVDNTYTVLDVADIVFFDPASTGYSRVAGSTPPNAYFSVDADARQLTQFIQAWSRKHGREAAPKFLFGESYGTMRAAVAAQQIAELKEPLNLRGVFLMGQALNIVETVYRPQNIVSYTASLPTLAAIGWHHGKVAQRGRTLEQFLDEVRLFARTDYLTALYQGNALDPAEERRVAARLAELTGLPAETYVAAHLRVSKPQYRGLLLKADGKILGANDARYAGPAGKGDPANAIYPAIFAAFDGYRRGTLGIAGDTPYVTDSPVKEGLDGWRWGAASPFGNWPYGDNLGKAMKLVPALQLAIGVGYEDTLTTTGASEYAIAQSDWPKDRTRILYYQGGHMAYTIEASLKKMTDDLRGFVNGAADAR